MRQTSHKSYAIESCEPQTGTRKNGNIHLHALTTGQYLGTPVPKDILPGLSTIGFWNASGPQDWGLEAHCNEGLKIMFLETGKMPFVAGQKKFNLRAGNFTIIRPTQWHQLGTPHIEPGKLHWLILDVGVQHPHQGWSWPKWVMLAKDDLAELTRKLRHNENPVWDSTPAIAQTFRELAHCVIDWDKPHMVSHLVINLNQVLIGILDALTGQQSSENKELTNRRRTVELFLGEIERSNIDLGESWTLDRMAARCSMGETTFSKFCHELVNANPVEFLNQCRLDRAARQLLEKSERSITEIALANGFNSSQYFATIFKERFHKTPRAYRKSCSFSGETQRCNSRQPDVQANTVKQRSAQSVISRWKS
jgi:AraC family L-rhamnose operon regulatory protein RhaS